MEANKASVWLPLSLRLAAANYMRPVRKSNYVDEGMLKTLMSMEFPETRCRRALIMTKNKDLDDAINWMLEHMDDPSIDEPIPSDGLYIPAPAAALIHQPPVEIELPNYDNLENKMVLCVRVDLNMSVGKVAAQCSHATLGLYRRLLQSNPHMLKDWERHGEKKVVLQIHSQKEMDEIELKAFGLSVPTQVIRDAGRTEVEPGTKTVIAVAGPAYMVDQVTGHLKLLR